MSVLNNLSKTKVAFEKLTPHSKSPASSTPPRKPLALNKSASPAVRVPPKRTPVEETETPVVEEPKKEVEQVVKKPVPLKKKATVVLPVSETVIEESEFESPKKSGRPKGSTKKSMIVVDAADEQEKPEQKDKVLSPDTTISFGSFDSIIVPDKVSEEVIINNQAEPVLNKSPGQTTSNEITYEERKKVYDELAANDGEGWAKMKEGRSGKNNKLYDLDSLKNILRRLGKNPIGNKASIIKQIKEIAKNDGITIPE